MFIPQPNPSGFDKVYVLLERCHHAPLEHAPIPDTFTPPVDLVMSPVTGPARSHPQLTVQLWAVKAVSEAARRWLHHGYSHTGPDAEQTDADVHAPKVPAEWGFLFLVTDSAGAAILTADAIIAGLHIVIERPDGLRYKRPTDPDALEMLNAVRIWRTMRPDAPPARPGELDDPDRH